jgi:hypothetical protein
MMPGGERPFRGDGASAAVDYADVRTGGRFGHIDEHALAAGLELERFGMGAKHDIADGGSERRADDAKRTLAIADPDLFHFRVKADVIGIAAVEIVRAQDGVGGCVEGGDAAVGGIGDVEALAFRPEQDALRLFQTGEGVDDLAGIGVDDFDGVIAEGGEEEAVSGGVGGHVVEAAFEGGERDVLFEGEGLGEGGSGEEKEERG